MSEVTRILAQIDSGDPSAADELLPLVYDELRKLAAARLAHENSSQTLQATALVHEAYLQLVKNSGDHRWNSRGHFFGAAAEAMRRILIGQARRKASLKAGGDRLRVELVNEPEIEAPKVDLLALDSALEDLAANDARAASVVKLRFFAGLTMPDIGEALGVSLATVENDWAYAKTWLRVEMSSEEHARP